METMIPKNNKQRNLGLLKIRPHVVLFPAIVGSRSSLFIANKFSSTLFVCTLFESSCSF